MFAKCEVSLEAPKPTIMNATISNGNTIPGANLSLDEQLLEIYWAKKELEEFLPRIATYATPAEVAAITLSQLSVIENRIVWLLQDIAKKNQE